MAETVEIIRPTPERLRHASDDEIEEFSPDENINFKTIRMLDGSPLEKLAAAGRRSERKGITGDQFNAGARYFGDAYYAGLLASGVIDPTRERIDGGDFKNISDFRLAAQTRFNHACRSIGQVHRFVLDEVVLAECPLATYADRFRRFVRHRDRMVAALTTLCLALDALDIHYHGHRRANGTRTSHSSDYRPAIVNLAEKGTPYDYDD